LRPAAVAIAACLANGAVMTADRATRPSDPRRELVEFLVWLCTGRKRR